MEVVNIENITYYIPSELSTYGDYLNKSGFWARNTTKELIDQCSSTIEMFLILGLIIGLVIGIIIGLIVGIKYKTIMKNKRLIDFYEEERENKDE